jgi:Tol biopolymer transport system component
VADVFVRDQLTGVITRISVSTNGVQGNGTSSAAAISGDGRWIAFGSEATNLASGPTLGRFFKVFVRDRQNSRTTLVSVHPAGGASIGSMAALSENGGFVAYTGESDQLYVRNLAAGQTTVIMAGANPISGYSASLSADGRYVAFSAKEDPNNTDAPRHIRVWDRWTGRSTAVTPLTRPEGSVSYFTDSTTPSISPDGSTIAFTSEAQNLVSNDLNDERDVFVQARPSL